MFASAGTDANSMGDKGHHPAEDFEPIVVRGKSKSPDLILEKGLVVVYREEDRNEDALAPKEGDSLGLAMKLTLSKTGAGLVGTKAHADSPTIRAAAVELDKRDEVIPHLQWIRTEANGGNLRSLAAVALQMRLGERVTVGTRALFLAPIIDTAGRHRGKCKPDDDITIDMRLVRIASPSPPSSDLTIFERVSVTIHGLAIIDVHYLASCTPTLLARPEWSSLGFCPYYPAMCPYFHLRCFITLSPIPCR